MVTRGRRKRQKCVDDDEEYRVSHPGQKAANELVDDDSDDPLDDLEPENIFDDGEDSKRAKKQKDKEEMSHMRRKRTEVIDANLNGDEEEDTVFIDNLPNDEFEIKSMLRQVRAHIKELEKQFFEEEDSDQEDQLKREQEQGQDITKLAEQFQQ